MFFKALKQNLRIKSFVGTTENALRIQIWTALIAMPLLIWLHHLSKAGWSLSNLASMLRLRSPCRERDQPSEYKLHLSLGRGHLVPIARERGARRDALVTSWARVAAGGMQRRGVRVRTVIARAAAAKGRLPRRPWVSGDLARSLRFSPARCPKGHNPHDSTPLRQRLHVRRVRTQAGHRSR